MQKLQFRAYSSHSRKLYTLEELEMHQSFDMKRLFTHQYDQLRLVSSTGLFLNQTRTPENEIFEGDILEISMGGTRQTDPYVVTSAAELYAEMNSLDSYMRLSVISRIGTIFEQPEALQLIGDQEDIDLFMKGEHEL